MNLGTNVSIGPASVLGWIAAAAGIVTSTVQSLEGSGALVSGPGKWPAILGVFALIATNAMRQFQDAHLTKAAAVAGDIAKVPAALEALAAEAQANVAKVAASPDVVQTAQVAYAQPSQEGAPAAPQG